MPDKKIRKFEKVCEILDKNGRDPARLIPILQAAQEEYRYLPEEIMTYIGTSIGVSPARVYGVSTFYSHFALVPRGKYLIRVCDGTACHVKKSTGLLDALRSRLGLSETKPTTDDMLFTVETVSCLGACGLSPALVINDDVHGQMTPEKAIALLDSVIAKEKENVR